jgi:uncharacterized membrane protein YbaN (DUF454 family)
MTARAAWLAIGCASVAAGTAGAVLPLVPTTPFLLLAAFAFARSSPRLHRWLVTHPLFGPMIDNWRRYGAISRRAKAYSLASMAAAIAVSAALGVNAVIIGVQAFVLGGAALFVATRPSPPQQGPQADT